MCNESNGVTVDSAFNSALNNKNERTFIITITRVITHERESAPQ